MKFGRALLVWIFMSVKIIYGENKFSGNGETQEFWNKLAQDELRRAKQLQPNIAVAKNVIIFLGDGMGISTVTAARILKGQLKNKTGEEEQLSFERFPYVGLSKTYNQDAQTADSAGTATAYFSGVKTNYGVLGVDGRSVRGNCTSAKGGELESILDWSKAAGKSVGLITTTRITHATPAALYANTPDRDWEGDVDLTDVDGDCEDISKQLIDHNIDINVILGGGRRTFLRYTDQDPEIGNNAKNGRRDGRNLIEDWQHKQANMSRSHAYVWNLQQFNEVDPTKTDYLLGLFNNGHMQYEVDRETDNAKEPSLAEMTEKAIQILSRNPNGFFLLVEGGRIDHGHHASQATRALHDTLAFDLAVEKGISMTTTKDTLTIITADHSHVFTIGGYPTRGNPILGLTDDREGGLEMGTDKKPFTTLNYANGDGSYADVNATTRPDVSDVDTAHKNYKQQSGVPLNSETHGGEDVAIYAQGPMSHLFHGVHEQHYIAHVMAYASCVGSYSEPDSCAKFDVAVRDSETSSAINTKYSAKCFILSFLCMIFVYFLHH